MHNASLSWINSKCFCKTWPHAIASFGVTQCLGPWTQCYKVLLKNIMLCLPVIIHLFLQAWLSASVSHASIKALPPLSISLQINIWLPLELTRLPCLRWHKGAETEKVGGAEGRLRKERYKWTEEGLGLKVGTVEGKEKENDRKEKARERVKTNSDWI